jgi:hypothetical protein
VGRHSERVSRTVLEPSPERAIRWVRDLAALAERLAARGVFVSRLDVDYSSALWQVEVHNGAAEDSRTTALSSSSYQVERFRLFWSSHDQELILSTASVGVLSSVDNWARQLVEVCESFDESLARTEQLISERVG